MKGDSLHQSKHSGLVLVAVVCLMCVSMVRAEKVIDVSSEDTDLQANFQHRQLLQAYPAFTNPLQQCYDFKQNAPHHNRSTIFVNEDLNVARIHVNMDISHPHIGGVKIFLRVNRGSEDTKQIKLKSFRHGGKGKNMRNVEYDDDSAMDFPAWGSDAPFTGVYAPEMPMRALYGPAKGRWTLIAQSTKTGRSAVIEKWSMTLCTGSNRFAMQQVESNNVGGATVNPAVEPRATAFAGPSMATTRNAVRDGASFMGFMGYNLARTYANLVANYNYANLFVQGIRNAQEGAYALAAAKHG